MQAKNRRAARASRRSFATMLVFLSAGCGKPGGSSDAKAPPPATVVVETAERRRVPIMVELVARTEAAATVEIRPNVEGRLTGMSFEEGHMVKKGQMLFRLDPRRYEAAVQSAAATVDKADADLEMAREREHLASAQSALRLAEAGLLKSNQDSARLKPLAARKAVPQRDLDDALSTQSLAQVAVEDARATVQTATVSDRAGLRQAQANLTAARAALEKAELDREETSIRAPIGGLIGRSEVSVGNYLGPGERHLLATISQLDPIDVVFSIPETLYLRTTSNGVDRQALDRLELILADNKAYPFPGKLANVGRAVDEKTGTLLIVAQFPNAKGILLPGMFGRVGMAAETPRDAVLVSERALFDVQGSKAVYIVTSGNKVALRSVVSDGSYQGKSIITRGLGGNETVIVEGILKVRPGQLVTAQTGQSAQAARDR
jgi:membrane fusion protein (multidrug efflux system)